jgi:Putative glutamine amidotransferase
MTKKICYLGDDDLSMAAVYLAGIMTHYGLPFDYIRSDQSPDESFTSTDYALYVLSDYPVANWKPGQLDHLAMAVRGGAGLAMFGGWESYHGLLGEYHKTVLADLLPVVMADTDDRRNFAQPCLVTPKTDDHPIIADLPWQSPPGIGGFNAFEPKPDAETILSTVRFSVRHEADWQFEIEEETPLLVVGKAGSGRTAALATDVAPHWIGGMVDWGNERVTQQLDPNDPDGPFIEVGNWYAQLFYQLLSWTAAS